MRPRDVGRAATPTAAASPLRREWKAFRQAALLLPLSLVPWSLLSQRHWARARLDEKVNLSGHMYRQYC